MEAKDAPKFRRILGINFFVGSAGDAIELMEKGGLLVVPAAPALKNLPHDAAYREALLSADLVITDSAFMVLIWNRLEHDTIRRVSGLEYLSLQLKLPAFVSGSFWIMASPESAEKNCAWLRRQGIELSPEDVYIAPMYGKQFEGLQLEDAELLDRLRERRPKHIVVTIGGGTQERLGLFLKRNLDYSPSIHCIGAAIAFLSGDQVHIPMWADRFYLGWLLRCLSEPRRYLPRYWDARKLFSLMLRYRGSPPDAG